MNINAGTVILPVGGDIDVSSADELRATIGLLIDDGCVRLILNMEKVGYVDSAGYAMLVASARRMMSHTACREVPVDSAISASERSAL